MNKTIKTIIKLIIAVAIILIITLGVILYLANNPNNAEDIFVSTDQGRYEEERIIQAKEETNKITYYAVKRIIARYADFVANKDTNSLYEIIDKNYIENKGITKENILENTENFTIGEELSEYFNITPYIDKMYEKQEENTDIISIISYGHFKYDIDNKRENFGIIVEIDLMSNTYYIIPTKEVMEKWSTVEEFDNFNSTFQKIEESDKNKLALKPIEDSTVINDLVGKYTETVQTDIEKAYNLLDEEYREKRFGTLENYQKYVDENKAFIISYNVDQYTIEEDGDITRYICKNSNDKYYIFEETAVLDYTLKLDKYTIETQNYIDLYNNGDETIKISMNIEKWMDLVNDREYEKAYEYLDATFRNDYFGSEEGFENYMKELYPGYYDIYIENISKESNAYAAKVNIVQRKQESDKIPDTNIYPSYIIMQLGSDRDFVMSFTVRRH